MLGCPLEGATPVTDTDATETGGDTGPTVTTVNADGPGTPDTGGNADTGTTVAGDDGPDGDGPDDGADGPVTDDGRAGSGCCSAHADPGCDIPDVAACVCQQSAYCCAFEWDDVCVQTAENSCGGCDGAGSGTDTGGSSEDTTDGSPTDTGDPTGDGGPVGGDCCEPTATPGCDNDKLETCVCGLDDFCCNMEWDDQCIQVANDDCDAMCDGGPVVPPPGCCFGGKGAACDDEAIEACVCKLDAECCDTWNADCVVTSINACDNMCPELEIEGTGECCDIQAGPGCGDADVQLCTCAQDPFCCDTQWDDVCVELADNACEAACDAGGSGGATGGETGGSGTAG